LLRLCHFCRLYDVVLIAGNGVLAWGDSIEQAYLRLELVEHLCRIVLLALPVGGIQPLARVAAATASRRTQESWARSRVARPGAARVASWRDPSCLHSE
jgi:ribulose-5-phosphate 4-epimerase/fuculose-1-phosphate aldolase